LGPQALQVPKVHKAYKVYKEKLDRVFLLKAQWPQWGIYPVLETQQVMLTLLPRMAIFMFGMVVIGTMWAILLDHRVYRVSKAYKAMLVPLGHKAYKAMLVPLVYKVYKAMWDPLVLLANQDHKAYKARKVLLDL
jgi:hypothetical protein